MPTSSVCKLELIKTIKQASSLLLTLSSVMKLEYGVNSNVLPCSNQTEMYVSDQNGLACLDSHRPCASSFFASSVCCNNLVSLFFGNGANLQHQDELLVKNLMQTPAPALSLG